jgi:hypothetical protein
MYLAAPAPLLCIELTPSDLVLSLVVVSMLVLGVGALLLAAFRPRATAKTIFLFGLFSCLYGARLLVSLTLFESIHGIAPYVTAATRQAMTYVVLLPLMFLVQEFIGPGWHGTMRATVWLQVVYTVAGLLSVFVLPLRESFAAAKPYIVIVIGLAALINILVASRRMRVVPRSLSAGFSVFFGTVGLFNLTIILHSSAFAAAEVIGYVVLVGCLAYAVAVYALDTETRLRLIDREVQSAQRIQTGILPHEIPDVRGLDVAVRYRPMTTVAGDFYDFTSFGDGRLGILIADVLGHGLGASLIASMLKVAFTAEAAHAAQPGAVLSGVNTTLVGLLSRDRDYVTACYVVATSGTGELVYANGGHPPPLLMNPAGSVQALEDGGTILGQFALATYSSHAITVALGSRLLLYTDGVTEAVNRAGEMFGLDRLKDLLRAHQDRDANSCAELLLTAVDDWRGGRILDDDLTVILVDIR